MTCETDVQSLRSCVWKEYFLWYLLLLVPFSTIFGRFYAYPFSTGPRCSLRANLLLKQYSPFCSAFPYDWLQNPIVECAARRSSLGYGGIFCLSSLGRSLLTSFWMSLVNYDRRLLIQLRRCAKALEGGVGTGQRLFEYLCWNSCGREDSTGCDSRWAERMVEVLKVMVGVGGEKQVLLGRLFYLFIKLLQKHTDRPKPNHQLIKMCNRLVNFNIFAQSIEVMEDDHFLLALWLISFAFWAQNPS